MENNIESINEYIIKENDTFILDTNVLVSIFNPLVIGGRDCSEYVKFYQNTIKKKAKIYISSIQVSEFVNLCIKFHFKLYKESNMDIVDFKKDYRGTEDYTNSMKAILEIVREDILSGFVKVSDRFDEMEDIFNQDENICGYDFNDALIARLCKINGARIVTNDIDYVNFLGDIGIITNNKRLLMFKRNH